MGSIISGLTMNLMRSKATKSDQDSVNIAKDQSAEEKYAALCDAGETISVVCRGFREEYYVLTNKRLIIDNKKGFNSILLNTAVCLDAFCVAERTVERLTTDILRCKRTDIYCLARDGTRLI